MFVPQQVIRQPRDGLVSGAAVPRAYMADTIAHRVSLTDIIRLVFQAKPEQDRGDIMRPGCL